MPHRCPLYFLVMLLLLAVPARPQEDEAGKDHPRIPRMPGYYIVNAAETDFDAFEFDLGDSNMKRVEGRSWQIDYQIKEGARTPSPLEIFRNYQNQVKAHGGRTLFQEIDSSGGTATFIMPGEGGGEVWIAIRIANHAELYTLNIIETAEMKQKLEFSASQMAEQLAISGRVALRGILFDTGKATIKPESEPLLDEVAQLLKADASLELIIEGHTDNVGQKPANLELSKRRAAAVKAALVARGVADARLATQGYGDTKPVADNSTEEGRAKNRRVELVKK